MEQPKAKKRIGGITFGVEKKLLVYMAKRLPAWMTPDKLTIIGILGAFGVGLGFWLTQYSLDWLWFSSAMLVVNWWGDSLDGTLARVRNIRREKYGFYVDHQADAISTIFIFGGLGLSPLMDLSVGLALIVAYFLMMIMTLIVTIVRDEFKLSFAGFGPTEARVLIVLVNILVWSFANPSFSFIGRSLNLYDILGLIALVLMVLMYTSSSLSERSNLAKIDPSPTIFD